MMRIDVEPHVVVIRVPHADVDRIGARVRVQHELVHAVMMVMASRRERRDRRDRPETPLV